MSPEKVSQAFRSPESKPVCSQWSRCAEVPWVKDSGSIRP